MMSGTIGSRWKAAAIKVPKAATEQQNCEISEHYDSKISDFSSAQANLQYELKFMKIGVHDS